MLKKYLAVVSVGLFCLATPGVRAAEAGAGAAASAGLRVAVLDARSAIAATTSAKAKMDAIDQRLKPDVAELRKLAGELQQLDDKARKDGEVMAEPARVRLGKEIEDKKLDYQFRANKLQKAQQEGLQELSDEMRPRLEVALKQLIEQDGYDLVLERSSVMWVNASHDITRRVVEKLNEKPAAAAAPAGN